jgi:mannose-6-phosphate isomerase-like protein (cupin superfamily)
VNSLADVIRKLVQDALYYSDLLTTSRQEIRAGIETADTGEAATLVLGNEVDVVEGLVNPDFKISMSSQTLKEIIQGNVDAFALAGRARSDEVRPIEFKVYNKNRDKEIWETIRTLLMYLFTPGKVKIRSLRLELAGQAHGAHPIPLVYWDGIRYSWFIVKTGETLNKEGERNSYPQLFIILEGKGKAFIGNEKFEIEPRKAIYVPKNCLHQIMAEEDVELIWLAWQT